MMQAAPTTAVPAPSGRVSLEWSHPRARPAAGIADEAESGSGLGLAMLMVVATAIRLLLLTLGPISNPAAAIPADAQDNVRVGLAIAEQGTLGALATVDGGGLKLTDSLPLPGYPLVVAGVETVGLPAQTLLILQIAAAAACVWLVHTLTFALLRNARAALAAAAVVALHPVALIAPLGFTPETLLAVLLLMGLAVVAQPGRRDFIGSLLAGVCFGAAALVAPVALAVAVVVGLWVCVTGRRWSAIGSGAMFTAAALAPAGLWMLRNKAVGWTAWPHAMPMLGSPELLTALPWADLSALQARAASLFADHGVHDLFSRLALTPPDVKPNLVSDVLGLGFVSYAGSDAGRWIAVACTFLDLALLALTVLGAALLLVRGRWGTLLLVLPLVLYAFAAWGGEPSRVKLVVLSLQGVLIGAVVLPGLLRTLAFWRHLRRAKGPSELDKFVAEPVTVRSGRPL